MIDYLIEMGFKKSDKIKQQVDIPDWIKRNKKYKIACVRGLIDTDGCIFTHCYKVNGKWYSYKKIAFRSFSKPLIFSVFKILNDCGINSRMAQENDLRIDSTADVKRYFELIGSHNQKHLKRYKK